MYKAQYLSPMVPSFNIEKWFPFLQNYSISTSQGTIKTYVILYKDHSTVHILRAGTGIGEMEFYLVVDDIEQVWGNIKDKLTGMKYKEPFDRDYGMREVHVIIPETKTLMFIGQAIQ